MPKFTVSLSDGTEIDVEADQQPTEQQVVDALKEHSKPEQIGKLKTFLEHGAAEIGPGAAFMAGFSPGANVGKMIPGPPMVKGAGYLLGGTITGTIAAAGAHKLQDAAFEKLAPELARKFQEELAAGEEQHPVVAAAGDIAGMLPSARVAPFKLAQLPFRAGLGAGMNLAVPAITRGRLPTKDEAIKQTLEGMAMGTILGESRFHPATPTKGVPDASEVSPPTEVHGDVRPQPTPAEGVPEQKGGQRVQPQTPEDAQTRQEGVLLTEEEYADAERRAIDEAEKLGSPAQVVEQFTGQSEDEPFAGLFMRPTEKGMEVRRSNFRQWLSTIPEGQRDQAIAQRVLEEHIHRHTSGQDASNYWHSLSGLEKMIEHYAYTKYFTREGLLRERGDQFSDTQLGHEALRRRMQKLMTGTSSEVAESARKERWTIKSLDALGDLVRNVREVGGTQASKTGLGILSTLEENLIAAKSAIGGEQPGAYQRNLEAAEKEASRVADMSPGEFADWAKSTGRGATGAGYDFAKSVGEEGRPILQRMAERQAKETTEALGKMRGAKPDQLQTLFAETAQRSARKQFFDEGLRLLDAGKAVEEGMTPDKAAEEHGVDVRDVVELAGRKEQVPGAYQRELSLEPGKKGEEKPTAAAMGALGYSTASQIENTGNSFISEKIAAGDVPTFKSYKENQSQHGTIQPGALYESYAQHLYNQLLNSTGEQLGALAKKVGVKAYKIADAAKYETKVLKPEGATPEVKEQMRAEAKSRNQRERYRNRIVGEIADKLIDKAVPELRAPERSSISPEDLRPTDDQNDPGFFDVRTEDLKNPTVLADSLTRGSRRSSRDPVSLTKRVTALLDSQTGKVQLVSTYPHGRSGAMLLDPSLSGVRAHRPLTEMLKRFRPIASMLLDEPVQNFKQTFKSVGDFENKLGTDARVASQHTELEAPTTEGELQGGIPTESRPETGKPTTGRFATPGQFIEGRGTMEGNRPITDAEAMAIISHAQGERGTIESPDDIKASLLSLNDSIAHQTRLLESSYTGSESPGYRSRPLDQPMQEGNRQALSGYRKLMRELEKTHPDASAEELIDRLANQVYENHKNSQTSDEFIRRTVAQGSPPTLQTVGNIPSTAAVRPTGPERPAPTFEPGVKRPPFVRSYSAPQARPEPGGGQLSPAGRMEVARQARQTAPYTPTEVSPNPELAARGIEISPFARGERPGSERGIFRFEKPRRAMDISNLKNVPRGTPEGPVPPPPQPKPGQMDLMLQDAKDTPGAYQRVVQAAKDQFTMTADDVRTIYSRRENKRNIPMLLDGADNASGQVAVNAANSIRIASTDSIPTNLTGRAREQAAKAAAKEGALRRKAAIPYIAAGQTDNQGNWSANKSKLTLWRAKLDIAEGRARQWSNDVNPIKRREGRKDIEYIGQMREAIDYAEQHWSDRTFVEGAQQYRKEVHDAIDFENANGSTTVERDNYIPGLFKGDYYAGRRLLGTQWRMPKKFETPYDAIKYGPYRLASQDVADLAHTRILAGRRGVERMLWTQTLTGIKDPPTGKVVAKQPLMVEKNVVDPATGQNVKEPTWQSPSPDYELVYSRAGSKPIAVLRGYQRLVRSMIRPSVIEDLPFGKEALATTGVLKHGVLLLLDTFHLARIQQYALASTGFKGRGWRGGYSALSYRAEDLPAAVDKGYISKAAADWALGTVELNVPKTTRTATGQTTTTQKIQVSRKSIADELIRQGLNASKITDALYKDAVENIPLIGEKYAKAISPYNKFLFDRFMPGVMLEAAVRNLETYNKSHPNIPLDKMARDVIRDINVDFGNMGRQGIFKSQTFRDLAQLVMLAPMWQEGLVTRELQAGTRVAALPFRGAAALMGKELPYRRGLPPLGVTGKMMGRGLATYFVLSQLINLATRRQFTWQNEEEGHKLDAHLPIGDKGLWFSPMSVFAETTHDFIRLGETKPQVMDRIVQMGENRLGPVGKMANILWTGNAPTGEKYASSGARIRGALGQVTPFAGANPISLTIPARAVGHAVAPGLIAPNPPGALPRQLASTFGGVKLQAGETSVARTFNMAQQFMQREGLKKDTGWQQVLTDDPSYTLLRRQLRNGDVTGAGKTYQALLKNRKPEDVIKAMKLWAKRPFTGSAQNEKIFRESLSDRELETYSRANEEREAELNKFYEFVNSQP